MLKFAQILDGIVLALFDVETVPHWDASLTMVDVTDLNVTPGQSAHFKDGEWYFGPAPAPAPVEPVYKTIYSHRDFILRIGEHYSAIERLHDENAALTPDQKNYELSRLFRLWEVAEVMDLNDADMHRAFGAFVQLGIMSQAEADKIMTPDEVA